MRSARERARAEVTAEIVAEAQRQLAAVGSAALSLRAVARELGVSSSAVYRYVSSRDELLTLLIVEAYDALGAACEARVAATAGRAPAERWVAAATAIRDWALDHPHEYALVYGTPVPGYEAPSTTIASGTRVTLALATIVRDAVRQGSFEARPATPVGKHLAEDLARVRTAIDVDVPDHVLVSLIAAWSQLFGLLSFELFGQTRNTIVHHDELFRAATQVMAGQLGLGGT